MQTDRRCAYQVMCSARPTSANDPGAAHWRGRRRLGQREVESQREANLYDTPHDSHRVGYTEEPSAMELQSDEASRVMNSQDDEIAELLEEANCGDAEAAAEVVDRLYMPLKRLAQIQMRRERPGHTLQPTALVHEVYLRLYGNNRPKWKNRTQLLGYAAIAMRRVLVEHARKHGANKRRGKKESLDGVFSGKDKRIDVEDWRQGHEELDDILLINEALGAFALLDSRAAKVVELRYFGGLTNEEIAENLSVSARSVERDWGSARAWLHHRIAGKARE
jgi:RNA polymerase sigma-70 factor (ECF subfamily)